VRITPLQDGEFILLPLAIALRLHRIKQFLNPSFTDPQSVVYDLREFLLQVGHVLGFIQTRCASPIAATFRGLVMSLAFGFMLLLRGRRLLIIKRINVIR
jgi:hypothetical protein